ncbi:conserved hypothetical protein [Methanocaldococcus vulcanius M7]|uniref:Uncharacterized protein n=1 Tax=Methanocaldococcus vulcanius (strain ATCC 700851 / DSM 12094 / M7) TaxID=579137 RepID=C9RI79_METVM|nr:hypothetical protein [Methanocaldococcus vulcanius]ACX73281.1 conserved hypothetical protein [Methanocaldococcus vulcanius M7]
MKVKVYQVGGAMGLFLMLLILFLLIVLAIFALPIFLILIGIFGLYILVKYKIRSFFSRLWYKLRRKKIKIEDVSTNGEVKINFAKRIEIEGSGEFIFENLDSLDETSRSLAFYLKNIGAEFREDGIYFRGYKVYPIFKKTYPLNEIITLKYPKNVDAVVLGLKGEPYDPKFLYLIPKDFLKEKMSISELRRFLID